MLKNLYLKPNLIWSLFLVRKGLKVKKIILQAGKKYTFSDYFNFNEPIEEILAELDYEFSSQVIQLPLASKDNLQEIQILKETFYRVLPNISMNSEMAKREFLIAPILVKVSNSRSNQSILVSYL